MILGAGKVFVSVSAEIGLLSLQVHQKLNLTIVC